jgi:trans-aconitate 2-methyltransferase
MSWSASQYTKFEDERNRPVRDLLARIPATRVMNAVDIGCGPGNSTELLRARFPEAVISGMDNSPDMIEAARKRIPGIQFEIDDIASWSNPGPFDVILANAALQWIPDHESLLPELVAKLAPGGSLAVQVPDNLNEPAHCIMREIAAEGPWAAKLADASSARAARREAESYYRLLHGCGVSVDLWRTTYYHLLAGGAAAVTEWFKGTGLRPFLQPLDEDEAGGYLGRYQAAVARAYPAMPDGSVLLPFPRLFFVATRAGNAFE